MVTESNFRVSGDETQLVRAIFEDSSVVESYKRRVARARRRAKLRSWRPRVRLYIRLFPKTRDRLAAMETELKRVKATNGILWDKVRALEKELAPDEPVDS